MIIAGCGYSGRRLARRELRAARPVLGIVSTVSSEQQLHDENIDVRRCDLDAREPAPALPHDRPIVYLIPPPRSGNEDPRLQHFLKALPMTPTRVVYASTTGIYGNRDGRRVSEQDAPTPQSDRARRRVAAEKTVREWCEARAVPWVVLRIPGIYGPHRLQLATVQGARPMLEASAAGPGNRIHVDDLVSALAAATTTQHTNAVYNVGDGDPMTNTEFVGEVARALNLPLPPVTDRATLKETVGARSWSFLRESRLVDTRAMRDILGVTPQYADPRRGIQASLNEMEDP